MLDLDTPLETRRLRIRRYDATDRASLMSLFGTADMTRYLAFGPATEETIDATLERRIARSSIEKEGDGILGAAVLRSTGVLVGEFMLRYTSAAAQAGELGWSVHPDHHGQGYATEGARAFMRLGFEGLDLHRATASCDARNEASIRVMERLGMRREACFREAFLTDGVWSDELVYAILRSEWEAGAR
jgi:RimJ/RimL family protein N-acetyltransferase